MSSGADGLRSAAARGADAGRPARRSRQAARADARQPHRARAGRARGVGAVGDARSRATGSARPRPRWSARRPARRSSCCASAPVTARASSSRRTCSSSPSAPFRTSPRRRGGSSPIADGPAVPAGRPACSRSTTASFRHRGRLLPTSLPRDRRLVLVVRPADLSRLHDADAGRDALPGVLAGADEGQDDPVGVGRRRSSPRR